MVPKGHVKTTAIKFQTTLKRKKLKFYYEHINSDNFQMFCDIIL